MAEELRWTARYRGISVLGDGGVLGGGVKVVDGGWKCQVGGKVNMGTCCCPSDK